MELRSLRKHTGSSNSVVHPNYVLKVSPTLGSEPLALADQSTPLSPYLYSPCAEVRPMASTGRSEHSYPQERETMGMREHENLELVLFDAFDPNSLRCAVRRRRDSSSELPTQPNGSVSRRSLLQRRSCGRCLLCIHGECRRRRTYALSM